MSLNPRQKFVFGILASAALIAIGVAGGGWWSSRAPMSEISIAPTAANEPAPQGKVLYWYDPMVPMTHFDKPGKSPFMDMDLMPKYSNEGDELPGAKIDPAVTQSLGVRLATVVRVPLATQIEATGLLGFNERDVAVVQTRSSGFVERVWPLAAGDVVRAGQPLAELVVPEWAAAQNELFAVKTFGDETLVAAARERLRLLGMPKALIGDVERNGRPHPSFTVRAPIAGVIQTLDVRTGMSLTAGQSLARISGLATVWLEVAVPEAMGSAVRPGVSATVRVSDLARPPIHGRVTAILPTLNEATRSLRVRIELPNRDGRLRPGMSAQVALTGTSKDFALAVPSEAIIRTGKRVLVVVANDLNRFAPVEVTLGSEIGNQTVITAGLAQGQKVVASGQFLLDSEASLTGIAPRAVGGGQ